MKLDNIVKSPLFLYAVGGLLIYLMFSKVFKGITGGMGSIIADREEDEKARVSLNEVLDPQFYKGVQAIDLLPRSTIETLAHQIEDAWGYFNDDEAEITDAFRSVGTLSQASQIGEAYSRLFGKDLYTDLLHKLSNSELTEIWDILKNKPRE